MDKKIIDNNLKVGVFLMQILVMYFSKSGNTKKLAEEIGSGVNQVDGASALVKPVSDVTKDDFIESSGIVASLS